MLVVRGDFEHLRYPKPRWFAWGKLEFDPSRCFPSIQKAHFGPGERAFEVHSGDSHDPPRQRPFVCRAHDVRTAVARCMYGHLEVQGLIGCPKGALSIRPWRDVAEFDKWPIVMDRSIFLG